MRDLATIILEGIEDKIQYAKEHEGINSDAGGTCGWFATADNLINFLNTSGKRFKNKYFTKNDVSDELMNTIINEIYDYIKDRLDVDIITWQNCPIVFNGKTFTMSIRRCYPEILDNIIEKHMSRERGSWFELHNGFGMRHANGLSYEDTVKDEIIMFLNTIVPFLKGDLSNKKHIKFTDIGLDSNYKKYWEIFIYKDQDKNFDGIIQDMLDDNKIDLNSKIYKSGTDKIRRNQNNQIFNKKTFKDIDKHVEQTLEESGKIISDITIESTKGPVYISVKMKTSQTSGVNFSACFNNETFQNAIKNDKIDWDNIKDPNNELEGFIQFCKTFGINPRNLYDQYKEKRYGLLDINTSDCDVDIISKFVQQMIGGNYWYINPSYAKFIPSTEQELSINIKDAYITESGQSININCTINGVKSSICFRTSGKTKWDIQAPYRLFISANILKIF